MHHTLRRQTIFSRFVAYYQAKFELKSILSKHHCSPHYQSVKNPFRDILAAGSLFKYILKI